MPPKRAVKRPIVAEAPTAPVEPLAAEVEPEPAEEEQEFELFGTLDPVFYNCTCKDPQCWKCKEDREFEDEVVRDYIKMCGIKGHNLVKDNFVRSFAFAWKNAQEEED